MKDLADQIDALHAKHREPWRVEQEPHDYPDGTTHFNHVRYDSAFAGNYLTVEVASYVTPELGELLCVLHNNVDAIVAALRERDALSLAVAILTNERDEARAARGGVS